MARCGSFAGSGYPYTGVLRLLKVALNYDYLWINLRVKGGAYGCMSAITRSGDGYFVSYRDPNMKETNDIYEGIPEYLENFNADERDMTKYDRYHQRAGYAADTIPEGSKGPGRLVFRTDGRDGPEGEG